MQGKLIPFPNRKSQQKNQPLPPAIDYDRAEQEFIDLLETDDLDNKLIAHLVSGNEFERALSTALDAAYGKDSREESARRFLQRVLYRINRLKLFWYDDLQRYTNERSLYLTTIRDRIERAWQQWEMAQLNRESYQGINYQQAIRDRTSADVDPPASENNLYFRDRVTEAGYRRLVAIASLDGLVEASQLSRTLGGVANEVHSVLTRLLVEEYGAGRLGRKHSSYFTKMLEELGMDTAPEAYFDLVPWQVLAIINHSFLMTERKRYFLRYIGGLLYGELTVPAAFRYYKAAGERLGLSEEGMSYWTLHIKVDELHGRWMIEDVALPLIDLYPEDAWEIVLGYDQQRLMSDRAAEAITQSVREAEQVSH
ncbi:iron-containing redox enzyme family protein [Desertifilum sp. FACHB-1129]|uniref:Iron-containing redox enzyme family protein n=1 Tax=Desertifilum tharense IPPAS B-1220 TaxID=1781255 RepID=A0A1E5QIN2_9CYAN|nr:MULTISPECIES: iron-containing redox enzyme family protein [Cyanophyceae]MCD8486405.1 iron-containing redox enzyme family protein [Desertifilum sp.]MDA0212369.1 iron-containing redox enzyme family protein [Cyanobacteria bacterium FC1]MDI9641049.1 iron-containing redox enzyme family protein [Geitlerinema splendidum]MBD2311754.1 iron-containing redox enzyme family protein [Desertifilum sp. FACHB-1129]MBD2322720.1 iron-containing redox enzyme family protein [Desertifilum sp. FACHB-866]